MERSFYGKIIIDLPFKLLTGTHIGNENDGFAIGGVNKVVIRDSITRLPIIPGSSLKGKLRSIVEAMEGMKLGRPLEQGGWYNREGNQIYRHEANNREEALQYATDRTFGSAGDKSSDTNHPARLSISDAQVTPETAEVLASLEGDFPFTEIKSENNLDRITSAANPRTLERVPAGSVFVSRLSYSIEDLATIEEDLHYLLAALSWLEDDFIGGNGSRGYGRLKFGLGQAEQLPFDTIASLPIRVRYKSLQSYLSGDEVAIKEYDSIDALRADLSSLIASLRG